ncbi:MAG: ferritin [Lentisphaerae bacterium GWF2_52_8]|nr:MAG: ferritin [Lentisphaerae bacterium GWF2_52_8]
MLSKKLEKAINSQINFELYSAYLYLSMSAHFLNVNLKGFANWMRVQTQEESVHAMKFYEFVVARGGKVILESIAAPKNEWKTPLAAFEDAYHHETIVTGRINDLVNQAVLDKDHASASFLQWFVNEQVEEEANALEIIQSLKQIKTSTEGLFMIDRELGTRVFMMPTGSTTVKFNP